jgi:fatty acid desaturase
VLAIPEAGGAPASGGPAARKQVLTSRDIRGRGADLALGGLNHQIEHHLFPSMPRPNLRRARPIVRAYCAETGIPYEETGLVDSYRRVVRSLQEAGNPPDLTSPRTA